jgi:hypothetical protein
VTARRDRAWLVVALVAAAAVALPSLTCGFFCDDYTLIQITAGKLPAFPHTIDLYRFTDGTAEKVHQLIDRGPFHWWTAPTMKLAFFRPFAGLLIHADRALFGTAPLGYHLHSILWYLGLSVAAALLYRRLLPRGAALFAIALYAVNDSHAMAISWIANRHASLSGLFGIVAIWAHVRAREEGWRIGWLLSVAAFAVALTAGETTLGAVAYVVCYELVGRRREDRLGRRIGALVPSGAVVLAFLVLYKFAGYGTAASASYIDPIAQPRAFLAVAPARALVLAGSLLFGPNADLVASRPELVPLLATIGAVCLVAAFVLARRALAAMAPEEGRHVGWLGVGAIASVIPSLGGFPGSRLVFMPSLGALAVVAIVLVHAWRARGTSRAWRYALPLVVFVEVVRPAAINVGSTLLFRHLSQEGERIARESELPPRPSETRVVLLAASDLMASLYTDIIRAATQGGTPHRAWWVLSSAPRPHRAWRAGPSTVEVEVADGGRMLEGAFEVLTRDPETLPFSVGDRVQFDGMKVRVVAERGGRPTRIAATFDRPLDDPALWFVVYRERALRRVTLPVDGSPLEIPWERGPLEP